MGNKLLFHPFLLSFALFISLVFVMIFYLALPALYYTCPFFGVFSIIACYDMSKYWHFEKRKIQDKIGIVFAGIGTGFFMITMILAFYYEPGPFELIFLFLFTIGVFLIQLAPAIVFSSEKKLRLLIFFMIIIIIIPLILFCLGVLIDDSKFGYTLWIVSSVPFSIITGILFLSVTNKMATQC